MKTAQTIEQTVKKQFARLFVAQDWRLFKCMAEFYLRCAVFLRTGDVQVASDLKLLVRNCQKRLFIGVGTELLLKAIYLKNGFLINRLHKGQHGAPAFPFTSKQIQGFKLMADDTYMLDQLINNLHKITPLAQSDGALRGLKIAKVFRNKEGHIIAPTHNFDDSNYSDIENSLIFLYVRAFNESLQVRFSFAKGEIGLWKVSRHGPAGGAV